MFFLDRPRRAGIRRQTGRDEKQSSANLTYEASWFLILTALVSVVSLLHSSQFTVHSIIIKYLTDIFRTKGYSSSRSPGRLLCNPLLLCGWKFFFCAALSELGEACHFGPLSSLTLLLGHMRLIGFLIGFNLRCFAFDLFLLYISKGKDTLDISLLIPAPRGLSQKIRGLRHKIHIFTTYSTRYY